MILLVVVEVWVLFFLGKWERGLGRERECVSGLIFKSSEWDGGSGRRGRSRESVSVLFFRLRKWERGLGLRKWERGLGKWERGCVSVLLFKSFCR